MTPNAQSSSGQDSQDPEKAQALILLEKRDAEFRQSDLYKILIKESDPSLTLEEVLGVSSKITGSLAAEVIVEREKDRG